MKKNIWVALFAGVLVLLALTCPKRKQHIDEIKNKVVAVTEKKIAENAGDNDFGKGLAVFGSMLTNQLVEMALEAKLEYNNYVFCSLGKIEYEGEMKTISVGVLNQIFTFSEEDLENIIEKGTVK